MVPQLVNLPAGGLKYNIDRSNYNLTNDQRQNLFIYYILYTCTIMTSLNILKDENSPYYHAKDQHVYKIYYSEDRGIKIGKSEQT